MGSSMTSLEISSKQLYAAVLVHVNQPRSANCSDVSSQAADIIQVGSLSSHPVPSVKDIDGGHSSWLSFGNKRPWSPQKALLMDLNGILMASSPAYK